jgi:carbon starvation protein CstA
MDKPPFEIKDLTILSYRPRNLEMYPMLRQEVELLVAGYCSVYLGLFGIAFGALATAYITAKTVVLSESDRRFFWTVVVITAFLSLTFGVLAIRDVWNSRAVMDRLRKETRQIEVRETET